MVKPLSRFCIIVFGLAETTLRRQSTCAIFWKVVCRTILLWPLVLTRLRIFSTCLNFIAILFVGLIIVRIFAAEVNITMMAVGSRATFGSRIVGSIPAVILFLFLYIYFNSNCSRRINPSVINTCTSPKVRCSK